MALPTPSTPGYTTFTDAYGRKWTCCYCLAQWLYWYQRLLKAMGLIEDCIDIIQLTGDAEKSAGTHSQGGVFDLRYQTTNAHVAVAREMGATATWRREPPSFSLHMHGVLNGCAHNDPARYQITAQQEGFNGLGTGGRAGPDPHPDPKVRRTWREGIEYAKAQVARIEAQEDEFMAMTPEQRAAFINDIADEVWSRKAAGNPATLDLHVVNANIKSGKANHQLDDVMDRLLAMGDTLASISARLKAVEDLVTPDLPTDPPDTPSEPVPAFGVDVSKWQTPEAVREHLAKPGYEFVIINTTTGLNTVSTAFETNLEIALASEDLVGFYHWSQTINSSAVTPDKSDPVGEARHFVNTIKTSGFDLTMPCILALDHEEELGTWAQRVAYAIAWCEEVQRLTGIVPVIYLNWNWIKGMRTAATPEQWDRLTKFPLWLAEWTHEAGKHSTVTSKDGTNPDSWRILIHQYDVVNNMDLNWTPDLVALKGLSS